jgi:hypothetical protein
MKIPWVNNWSDFGVVCRWLNWLGSVRGFVYAEENYVALGERLPHHSLKASGSVQVN